MKKIFTSIFTIFFLILLFSLFTTSHVSAAESALCAVNIGGVELTPENSLPACTSIKTEDLGFKIPSLGDVLTFAIRAFFVVAGLMGLFYLLLGALSWITSGGDKDSVGAAQQKIQAAIIGMILIVAVLAIIWTLEQVIFNRRICLGLSCPLTLPGLIKATDSKPFCCVCIDDEGNRGDRINAFTDSCENGLGNVLLPAPLPPFPPEAQGQLVCDAGSDPYDSNVMRITNLTGQTIDNLTTSTHRCTYIPDKIKKGFYKCQTCEGDQADDPNCQNGTFDQEWSIPQFSLAPNESKVLKIPARSCEIVQVDVYNSDVHVDDSPVECFNPRSANTNPAPPTRWPGGIAFMINQNEKGYDAAAETCIVPTSTVTPTSTITPTPTDAPLPATGAS